MAGGGTEGACGEAFPRVRSVAKRSHELSVLPSVPGSRPFCEAVPGVGAVLPAAAKVPCRVGACYGGRRGRVQRLKASSSGRKITRSPGQRPMWARSPFQSAEGHPFRSTWQLAKRLYPWLNYLQVGCVCVWLPRHASAAVGSTATGARPLSSLSQGRVGTKPGRAGRAGRAGSNGMRRGQDADCAAQQFLRRGILLCTRIRQPPCSHGKTHSVGPSRDACMA